MFGHAAKSREVGYGWISQNLFAIFFRDVDIKISPDLSHGTGQLAKLPISLLQDGAPQL